jgi:hypothetical protein
MVIPFLAVLWQLAQFEPEFTWAMAAHGRKPRTPVTKRRERGTRRNRENHERKEVHDFMHRPVSGAGPV